MPLFLPLSLHMFAIFDLEGVHCPASLLGLAAHLSNQLEASKQGGLQETGCNDPSFQKSKTAVIAAIALHEKADATTIECVDNSVQVAFGSRPAASNLLGDLETPKRIRHRRMCAVDLSRHFSKFDISSYWWSLLPHCGNMCFCNSAAKHMLP